MEKELSDYIHNHTSEEENILQELNRKTHLAIYHPRMLSGHLQGKFLQMICRMIKPEKILEIGTYTGYSSICMALATHDDTIIYTIEKNDEIEDFTKQYFIKANVSHKIRFIIGDAIEIIPGLNKQFDLVFIDGDKYEYPEYYQIIFPFVKKGGFIIADNVLWGEKVISKNIKNNDYDTQGILKFNEIIQNDERVENVMLPVRDGIMIIRKK